MYGLSKLTMITISSDMKKYGKDMNSEEFMLQKIPLEKIILYRSLILSALYFEVCGAALVLLRRVY